MNPEIQNFFSKDTIKKVVKDNKSEALFVFDIIMHTRMKSIFRKKWNIVVTQYNVNLLLKR